MITNNGFRRCVRCIMDNSSDETIVFNEMGECDYCTTAFRQIGSVYFPNQKGQTLLANMLEQVKVDGKNKKYDCIMGLSGGLDSSYLVYLGYLWGLRVLVVHIDDGFDTDVTENNLQRLISKTGFDYKVISPDRNQFNALTKAYFRAGVPNAAVPQDNVLTAFLYACTRKYRIQYVLSGVNFALESILQRGNTHSAYDLINLKDINRCFGEDNLDKLKLISSFRAAVDRTILKIKTFQPLNFIDYNRDKAFDDLYDFCGYEYYGRKHLENSLTEFIQLYWFPHKFNVDKRTSHLSSMIVSGQITRDEALTELQKPLYEEDQMNECIAHIKEKLGISDTEFEEIMRAPTRQHTDFKTQNESFLYKILNRMRLGRKC